MLTTILPSILSGDTNAILEGIIVLLMWIPIIVFSLSVHESAHALIAYKLGDPTARNFGRISLNPSRHLDPMGFIIMLLIGFGWAKPVPINARNFKKPKIGMAVSALAGPVSNLMLALISTFIMSCLQLCTILFIGNNETAFIAVSYVYMFFSYSAFLNFALAIFNFIPIPPLDGSRIISLVLPTKVYFGMMKYERYIGIGFFVLVVLLNRVFDFSIISATGSFLTTVFEGLFSMLLLGVVSWIL